MRFIAVLVSILLVFVGVKLCLTGNKLYDESQVFPQAEKVTYDRFAEDRPLSGWYQISHGQIDLTEGAFRASDINVEDASRSTADDLAQLAHAIEVYVPVHNDHPQHRYADIILLSRDTDLVGAIKSLAKSPITDAHTLAPRIIKGMVRLPSELPDRVRRALGASINTQSIIVEEYAAPSAKRAIETMASGGFTLIFTACMWLMIWKQEKNAPTPLEGYFEEDLETETDEEPQMEPQH